MRLYEIDSEYEVRKAVMYNVKGDKALYHNKKMRNVCGNIYAGEPENDGYGNLYCNLYAVYDGVDVALYIGNVINTRTDDDIARSYAECATLDSFLGYMERRIAANEHIQLIHIEFIKHCKPEMEPDMWKSREAFAVAHEKREQERRERDAIKTKEFIDNNHKAMEKIIRDAINTIKTGGVVQNEQICYYVTRYETRGYKLFNYLFRMYGVDVPIRTQGFVNNSLKEVHITEDGRGVNYRYWKHKNSKGSQTIFDCLYKLVAAVRESDEDKPIILEG